MINEFDENVLTRTYFHSPQEEGRAALGHVDGANPASGAYRYYTHDHLGSTRGVYDHAKTRLARFDYTPYGEAYHAENPGITTRQFTGHDWSPQTGLYFAPFRYYNPAASRWLSRDPLGMVDGPNVYAYVKGNPISAIDILGLCGECDSKAEAARNAIDTAAYRLSACVLATKAAMLACMKAWKGGTWGVVGCVFAIVTATAACKWAIRAAERASKKIDEWRKCVNQHSEKQ